MQQQLLSSNIEMLKLENQLVQLKRAFEKNKILHENQHISDEEFQKSKEDYTTTRKLLTLQRENDHLKLYIAAITRLLISKGVLDKEEIEKMVDIIDAEDGAMDGKARGEVL